MVERRDWSEDAEATFELLYGTHPTRLGRQIIELFNRFAHGEESAPADQAAYKELLDLLLEERLDALKDFQLYNYKYLNQPKYSPSTDGAEASALTQEAALDRQIEAKVKLLLQLKGKSCNGAKREQEACQGGIIQEEGSSGAELAGETPALPASQEGTQDERSSGAEPGAEPAGHEGESPKTEEQSQDVP